MYENLTIFEIIDNCVMCKSFKFPVFSLVASVFKTFLDGQYLFVEEINDRLLL